MSLFVITVEVIYVFVLKWKSEILTKFANMRSHWSTHLHITSLICYMFNLIRFCYLIRVLVFDISIKTDKIIKVISFGFIYEFDHNLIVLMVSKTWLASVSETCQQHGVNSLPCGLCQLACFVLFIRPHGSQSSLMVALSLGAVWEPSIDRFKPVFVL